eukprot:COSAG01_NODE_63171_length_281_cov_0.571429_1_plen_55_part_01
MPKDVQCNEVCGIYSITSWNTPIWNGTSDGPCLLLEYTGEVAAGHKREGVEFGDL